MNRFRNDKFYENFVIKKNIQGKSHIFAHSYKFNYGR
jgi:hypothetical protein